MFVGVVVGRFFIASDKCGTRGRAALGNLGPGSRRGYVGMGTDNGNPAPSRRTGTRSSMQTRNEDVLGLRIRALLQYENVKAILFLA